MIVFCQNKSNELGHSCHAKGPWLSAKHQSTVDIQLILPL